MNGACDLEKVVLLRLRLWDLGERETCVKKMQWGPLGTNSRFLVLFPTPLTTHTLAAS